MNPPPRPPSRSPRPPLTLDVFWDAPPIHHRTRISCFSHTPLLLRRPPHPTPPPPPRCHRVPPSRSAFEVISWGRMISRSSRPWGRSNCAPMLTRPATPRFRACAICRMSAPPPLTSAPCAIVVGCLLRLFFLYFFLSRSPPPRAPPPPAAVPPREIHTRDDLPLSSRARSPPPAPPHCSFGPPKLSFFLDGRFCRPSCFPPVPRAPRATVPPGCYRLLPVWRARRPTHHHHPPSTTNHHHPPSTIHHHPPPSTIHHPHPPSIVTAARCSRRWR